MRARRNAEQMYEEANSRVNELTTINVNISAAKSKLEQEYQALQGDYDEIGKELRVSHSALSSAVLRNKAQDSRQ